MNFKTSKQFRRRSRFKPYDAAPARFVKAIKSARHRNLIDELLGAVRVAQLSGAFPVSGEAMPGRAPPMHTATELAALWPLICKGLLGYHAPRTMTPTALATALEAAGLPIIRNADDGQPGHIWQGRRQVYFWTVWPVVSLYLTNDSLAEIMAESFG